MPLYFQSLSSSSSGNCLVVRSDSTTILIDCGLGSIRRTKQALNSAIFNGKIDLVLISHLHSDHISYYPLKFFQQEQIPINVHRDCFEDLINMHLDGKILKNLKLETYDTTPFTVGDIKIEPFEIPHQPDFVTCGFVICHNNKKFVIATDLQDWRNQLDYFIDADFIFVESNHDLELLRQYFNPNSLYHLSNPKTSQLLCSAIKKSAKTPQAVMLGHLSKQRNKPQIAIREIESAFKKDGTCAPFRLLTAPLYESSEIVKL